MSEQGGTEVPVQPELNHKLKELKFKCLHRLFLPYIILFNHFKFQVFHHFTFQIFIFGGMLSLRDHIYSVLIMLRVKFGEKYSKNKIIKI